MLDDLDFGGEFFGSHLRRASTALSSPVGGRVWRARRHGYGAGGHDRAVVVGCWMARMKTWSTDVSHLAAADDLTPAAPVETCCARP